MTTPDAQPTAEERPEPAKAATGPTVTTAPPPRAGRRWSHLPSHVGPARTSTIALAVLFVGLFVLWLYVRPHATATAGTTGTPAGTGQQTEQPTGTPSPTPAPTTTAAPTTSTHTSATTPTGTTTTGTHPTSGTPTETTGAPGRTTGGTSLPSLPTTGSAPTS